MGTPLGPKYIPYTYMDPLGSSEASCSRAAVPVFEIIHGEFVPSGAEHRA